MAQTIGLAQHPSVTTASSRSTTVNSIMPLSHTPPRPSIASFSTPAGVMSSPSLSNAEGFFGRDSRADSIGTLWSSADVPLILEGHRGSADDGSSSMGVSAAMASSSRSGSSNLIMTRGLSATSTPISQTLHGRPAGASASTTARTVGWMPRETLLSEDGEEFMAVRPSARLPKDARSRGDDPAAQNRSTRAEHDDDARLPGGWTVSDDQTAANVATLQQPGSRPSSAGEPQTSTPQKKRPARLHLTRSSHSGMDMEDRNANTSDVPISVSTGSHLTLQSTSVKSKLSAGESGSDDRPRKPSTSPAAILNKRSPRVAQPAELYRHAERYFDPSYSMIPAPPAVPAHMPLPTPAMARMSRFSDDSNITNDDADSLVAPAEDTANGSYARSQHSHSSAESSSPPEVDDTNAHLLEAGLARPSVVTEKYDGKEPMTPLRVAMSLATPSSSSPIVQTPTPSKLDAPATIRRPSTTDTNVTPKSPQRPPRIRHAHTSSDQELLRRLKTETGTQSAATKAEDKLAFLHAPAPPMAGFSPPSPKRGALFGLRIRAVSTPRLRQSRSASQDGTSVPASNMEKDARPMSNNRSQHPPQAPSGRFRTPNPDDMELCQSNASNGSLHHTHTSVGSEETTQQQPRPRRPSSTEALAAAARRFRKPSRNESNTSLGTTATSVGEGRQRLGSSASSQMTSDLHHMSSSTSLRAGSRRPKASTPTSSARPKTKGGWASHLSHGLTLHIEQGNKKFACRMKYLYYDPFGRPESLCPDEHQAAGGRSGRGLSSGAGKPRSRNGSVSAGGDSEQWPEDQTMGVLEFTPDLNDGQTSPTHMAFMTSVSDSSPVVLKHLTIGEDTRADLITRQADLSLGKSGTHEVSGSERKGKVSWRFVFGVEDLRRDGSAGVEVGGAAETVEGVRLLQPLRFSCSTTLLDPTRARKARVINMIRKQIGPRLESHSVLDAMDSNTDGHSSPQTSPIVSSRLEAPISPSSLARSRDGQQHADGRPRINSFTAAHASPTTTRAPIGAPSTSGSGMASGEDGLLDLRNDSVISVASSSVVSATWSPMSRPGLVPFKIKRPMVDALRGSGRVSTSEQGAANQGTSGMQSLQGSPLVTTSSLSSPLTSVDGSPSPAKSVRELGSVSSSHAHRQQHFARHTHGPAPSTALGLETNSSGVDDHATADVWYEGSTTSQWASSQTRVRARHTRTRTEEEQQQPSRPPTASEEIKLAYLKSSAASTPTALRTANESSKQRHGGNGSGHGHSHSVVQPPSTQPFAGPVPPRRLTSASINVSRPTSAAPGQQPGQPLLQPSSPVRRKRLPPTPQPRRGPFAAAAAAARAISGQGGSSEAPEGPFWM